MENYTTFKNVFFKDQEISILLNGVTKISYSSIEEFSVVQIRSKRWLIEVIFGLLFISIPVALLFEYGIGFILHQYSMNVWLSFLILSTYAMFLIIGFSSLGAIKKKYYLNINKYYLEIDIEKIVKEWDIIVNILVSKGVSVDKIKYFPNQSQAACPTTGGSRL
jgi:hypothetical protein